MLKVMRSQLYQLVLDKVIFLVLLIWLLFGAYNIYTLLTEIELSGETISGGEVLGEWFQSGFLFVLVITVFIMTKDLFDKTLYYELLSGKSRAQVFMGRFFISLAVSEVCALLALWVFPAIYTLSNGWGENLSFSGVLFRTLLEMLFVFRVCAEAALFSMLFKRKGLAYLMIPIVLIIPDMICSVFLYSASQVKTLKPYLPWLSVFMTQFDTTLCEFVKVKLQNDSGENITYLVAVPDHVGVMVFCSLGLGLIMLAAAYRIFARKDME